LVQVVLGGKRGKSPEHVKIKTPKKESGPQEGRSGKTEAAMTHKMKKD